MVTEANFAKNIFREGGKTTTFGLAGPEAEGPFGIRKGFGFDGESFGRGGRKRAAFTVAGLAAEDPFRSSTESEELHAIGANL